MRQDLYILLDKCFHFPSTFSRCIAIDGWSALQAGGAGILDLKMYFNCFFKPMVLIARLLMLKPSAHTVFPRVVLMVIGHFIWQPVEMIQVRETLVTLVSTKMIDSFGTSALKKTQLMSSHLYKYLSGDCLILQAIETYPSVPMSWSLQCPLHLILWHCARLFPLQKKQFSMLPHQKGNTPLSRNRLKSRHGKSITG